jgi:long-chain acyl-CoA synthetase
MLDFKTINSLFERMSHRGDTTVVLEKNRGEWTADYLAADVRPGARPVEQLRSWGIKRGDRVGIISENRWEWPVADFAVLAIGAVDVPLYQTSSAEQMGFILRDAGVRAVFVSSKQQYAKLVARGNSDAGACGGV